MAFTPAEQALLAPYVTNLDRPIFALRQLPEEVIAVLFAYYSRSRDSLRGNLLRLLQDQDLLLVGEASAEEDLQDLALARAKAREFHEKWVVGYGHASVAEHAVAHIAVEDVSIVVSKAIEDCRLAAYTEKSTRYVPFPRAFRRLDDLPSSAAASYHATLEHLFDVYEALLPRLTEEVATRADRSQFKTERGFLNSCQAQACDALRSLLPAACHTNLGITANARTLEHMISKLLSSPLQEARDVGECIREEATRLIPTLIKYARPSDYARETPPRIAALAATLPAAPRRQATAGVDLVSSPPHPELDLATAILYGEWKGDFGDLRRQVESAGGEFARQVIQAYLDGRRRYGTEEHGYTDPPLRCLEHLYFTMEIVVDYGAYRDIQRHRMATQTDQLLDCSLGYDVPPLVEECGAAGEFHAAMTRAAETHALLAATHPLEAQYVVPLAYRKRVLFTWNLRALHHFISLRSARQGHPSYRRIAQQAWEALHEAHPFLAQFIRVDRHDYAMTRPG